MGDESSSGGAGTTEPGGGSSEGEWETGEGGENPGGETGEDGQNPGGGDSGDGGDGGQNPGGGNTDEEEGDENNPDGETGQGGDNTQPAPDRNKNIGSLTGSGLWNNLGDLFNDLLNKFRNADNTRPQGVDPLLVDLDGNGIQTTSIYDGYMMDHEADGFAELSAWVGGNDGILAYDKNGNGIIDNGNEIFGDNYIKSDGTKASSGFDALADLDSNNDGLINSSDEKFSDLQVIKADGSIVSASDAGIASINLASQQTNQSPDANGNTALSTGTFTTTDGETNVISEYILDSNKLYSIETENIEIPDEIAA